jgi:outer membrane cobalamin receptor
MDSRDERHHLGCSFSFGESVKKKSEFEDDQTVGNRLPYDPGILWNVSGHSELRGWRAGFLIRGRGLRYITYENRTENSLPAHTVLDIWFQKRWQWNMFDVSVTTAIDNLFNESYQIIKGYPMSGRIYGLEMSVRYN